MRTCRCWQPPVRMQGAEAPLGAPLCLTAVPQHAGPARAAAGGAPAGAVVPADGGGRAEGHLHEAKVPARCVPASAHLRPHSMSTMSFMAQSSSLVPLTSLTQPSCTVQGSLKHCTAACQPSCVAQACAHMRSDSSVPSVPLGQPGLLCFRHLVYRGSVALRGATAGCPMLLPCWSSCRACRWQCAGSVISSTACVSSRNGIDQWQEVHAHRRSHAQAVVKANAAFCDRPAQGGHARHILCHSGGLQTPKRG